MNLSSLSGAELDFFVAKALERDQTVTGQDKYGAPILDGRRSLAFLIAKYAEFPQAWSPSTKWEDGGPIIEREGIGIENYGPQWWGAGYEELPPDTTSYGETPLIAAMRCFVASRLGDK